ncbi:MAG: hypothetical protein IPN01_27035 [Deltaproteobacteria bacterium]|nr:hypothetical protein [Deltaproteobacteria bacterium]
MSDPTLLRLGARRALEGAVEALAPLGLAGLGWGLSLAWLSGPTAAVGVTPIELGAVLGANAALTGWAGGRLAWLTRRRGPRQAVGLAWALFAVMLLLAPRLSADRFAKRCAAGWEGVIVQDALPTSLGGARAVCQIGAVAGNPYLPGRLLRPRWAGAVDGRAWPPLLLIVGLAALGWRDRRLRPTRIGEHLLRSLPYAPGAGWAASPRGGPDQTERVEACANVTWWGELCGQLYPGASAPQAGQACLRCHQAFRPAEGRQRLTVVSLVTADVDVLNGWERQDMVTWERGEGARDERSKSAAHRWVVLGELELPDVLTVAQALALIHARLPVWAEGDEARSRAAALASARASRVSAWLWAGATSERLNRARPEREAVLALGPQRLRDLPPRRGEALWLQLDVGLLPLELWEGRASASKERCVRRAQWIPVASPRRPAATPGLWVPRVEGDALRAWLRSARRRDAEGQLAPYLRRDGPPRGDPALDLVLRPKHPRSGEPSAQPRPGESVAEWLWLERAQIQSLRRDALVMVEK